MCGVDSRQLAGYPEVVWCLHRYDVGFLRLKPIKKNKEGKRMRSELTSMFIAAALTTMGGAAMAHHSFAMFNQEHPIEIAGTVVEFRYTSPHSFILVDVKGKDGASTVWNLEGPSPSILARDGMSAKTLKPGDELVLTIDPLRSGAPGGAWALIKTKFKDGRPIAGQ
jgi:hypothetical protein